MQKRYSATVLQSFVLPEKTQSEIIYIYKE